MSAWAAELRIAAGGPFELEPSVELAQEIGARRSGTSLRLLLAVEETDVPAVVSMARAGVRSRNSSDPAAVTSAPCGRRSCLGSGPSSGGLPPSVPDGNAGPLEPRVVVVDARRGLFLAPGGVTRFRLEPVLLELLRVLAQHPDGASKETLTLRAWRVDDTTRCGTTTASAWPSKLRRRVEPLLDRPLLDTLQDGYALTVPLVWLG